MIKKIIYFILFFGLSSLSLASESITIVTEDFPPYNYVENGHLSGTASMLIKDILLELDMPDQEITLLPWARAYQTALTDENVLIYSIIRCEERESDFKWVGKIGDLKMCFIKLKIRDDISVTSIEDLKKYRIGLTRDTAPDHILKKYGIEASEKLSRDDQVINMLLAGRIDVLPAYGHTFKLLINRLGYSKGLFEKVYCLDKEEKELYIAFSNKTSDEIVEKFKRAFQIVSENITS